MSTAVIASISYLVCAHLLRVLHPLAYLIGHVDQPGLERRKDHGSAVPLTGGVAIFIGVSIACILVMPWEEHFGFVLLGALLLVGVGAVDDRYAIGYRKRLLFQLLAAVCLVVGGGVRIESLGDLVGLGELDLGLFAIPFTLFAVVGIINAFNMIDGIDGLAASLALIALLGIGLTAGLDGGPLLLIPLATAVALIPFLVANLQLCDCFGPKVFLGDAGSMLLGYILVWAMIEGTHAAHPIDAVTALWFVAVPLLDTFNSMGRRYLKGWSPFEPDRGHLHHVLTRHFRSARKALAAIVVLALGFAGFGALGWAQELPEAGMFYSSLMVFVGFVLVLRFMPRLHLSRGRRQRKLRQRRSFSADQQPQYSLRHLAYRVYAQFAEQKGTGF